jgi:ABC-type transport system involved in multi-copper enzyme maturation permease subunit
MQVKEAEMLWNLYVNENTKLFRRALYWVGLAILVVLELAILGLFFAMMKIPALSHNVAPETVASFKGMLTWPAAFYGALQLCGTSIGVGGLLALVLVGVVVAQEYPWRTLNLVVGHGIPRSRILAAKILSIFTALAGWLVILMLVVGAVTAFTTGQVGVGFNPGSVNFPDLGLSVLRVILALGPYVALAFCLAIATRSTVAAIGVVAGLSLIVEPLCIQLLNLMGSGMSRISGYLPMMLSMTLLKANGAGAAVTPAGAMDPTTAAVLIAVYTGLFLLAAFPIFRRQDLSS